MINPWGKSTTTSTTPPSSDSLSSVDAGTVKEKKSGALSLKEIMLEEEKNKNAISKAAITNDPEEEILARAIEESLKQFAADADKSEAIDAAMVTSAEHTSEEIRRIAEEKETLELVQGEDYAYAMQIQAEEEEYLNKKLFEQRFDGKVTVRPKYLVDDKNSKVVSKAIHDFRKNIDNSSVNGSSFISSSSLSSESSSNVESSHLITKHNSEKNEKKNAVKIESYVSPNHNVGDMNGMKVPNTVSNQLISGLKAMDSRKNMSSTSSN